MTRGLITAALTLGLCGPVLATESPFAAPNDESHPQVVAAYQQQCAQWADENALAGEARDGYLKSCLQDMPQVWPVGEDKAEE